MDPTTLRLIQGAAGAAASSLYVDDVFSTYLFEGSVSPVTITNGLDLSGEGGMIWIKSRTSTASHTTSSSANNYYGLMTPNTDAADADSTTQYVRGTSTGFEVTMGNITPNDAGENMASWSFRKAPGFFTCVQYTGTGSNRTVAHDLASTPGMIFVKCTNTAGTNWLVYHRSLGATKAEILDLTSGPVGPSANYWNNTAPTSTEFTVGVLNDVNTDGDTYVAYLFAHDEPVFGTDEDESIIKCGSFTTNASGTLDAPVDLGFEPQFILTKQPGGQWYIFDIMRGVGATNTGSHTLRPNSTAAEQSRSPGWFAITSTGFDIPVSSLFSGNSTVPYMAIRRPNKPPSDATDVFSPTAYTGNTTARVVGTNLCDFAILSDLDATAPSWSSWAQYIFTRLLGPNVTIATSNLNNEATGWAAGDTQGDYFQFDVNNNKGLVITALSGYMNTIGTNYALYNFTRSPGFMDVVAYTASNQSPQNITHNLNAEPELIIFKTRSNSNPGWVYVKDVGVDKVLQLGADIVPVTSSTWLNNTAPTSSVLTVGSGGYVNYQTWTYIAYLFATLPGISKVSSYSGTAATLNVDCGFSSGARFILIKRTDVIGDWYVYDSARGIVSGNDPYVLLNTDAAQVTNTDYIDPLASGFTVTSSAPVGLNADGGTYIFLAIA